MSFETWEAPKGYRLSHSRDLEELVNDEKVCHVIDPIDQISDDIFELRETDRLDDGDARREFTRGIKEEGVGFGEWFHYPWSSTLVRFPEEEDHYDIRTFRNRNLITKDEQRQIREKKIAIFGLSVGSRVVDETLRAGIGSHYIMFDPDTLSVANLNRIQAGMAQVGLHKTTVAGRKMSELDPYIQQSHYTGGYNDDTDEILRSIRPDVIVEEVDNLSVKARLRRVSEELKIPLVMAGDVADRSTVDIERHDIEIVKPFNGKVSQEVFQALLEGTLSEEKIEGMLIKILGIRNISPRLLESAMLRGKELAGFPQLSSTAATGGALATVAMRDIFLGRGPSSVARVHNPQKVLKTKKPASLQESVRILRRYVGHRKGLNEKDT